MKKQMKKPPEMTQEQFMKEMSVADGSYWEIRAEKAEAKLERLREAYSTGDVQEIFDELLAIFEEDK